MYAHTLFRGAKDVQNWKILGVFGDGHKFWRKKDGGKLEKSILG